MFAVTSDRQRTLSQPFSAPYSPQDYHLSPGSAPSRADIYPHRGGDIYRSSTRYTHSRESLSPAANFNQSYDRRRSTSPSDFHDSPSVLYHSHGHVDSGGSHIGFQMKQGDMPDSLDNFSISNSHITFRDPIVAVSGSSSEHSGDSDFWPNNTPEITQGQPPKPRKTRREKPRIELAPGQPPTTQGKPRARVYVACLQCRTRKIRCDGASPVCHNCARRTNGNNECNYDPIPKRRGPDKTPGARQRMARDIRNEIDNKSSTRRRRRTRDISTYVAKQTTHQQLQTSGTPETPKSHRHVSGNSVFVSLSPQSPDDIDPTGDVLPVSDCSRSYLPCGCHGLPHCPVLLGVGSISASRKRVLTTYDDQFDIATIPHSYSSSFNRGYIAELDENGKERHNSDTPAIGSAPSLNFSRKIWWDTLLSLYFSPTSTHLQTLTVSQREYAARGITSDIRFLFRTSDYWLAFFHVPSFFANFFDPGRRERIQPSLVLALLAMSTFWRSSEFGYGNQGRERALRFRDEAQASLDASFNAGWIDETLAQAAWLLACFEVCSHPRRTSQRSRSSMLMLDSIICSLSLTLVDADDPSACSPKPKTVWLPEQPLPSVSLDAQHGAYDGHVPALPTHAHNGCNCHRFTLGDSANEYAPNWSSTPAWDETWSEADIRKESCRRLCWSSMILAAGHVSYTTAQRLQGLDLFIADPANYALLFSGESIARSPSLSNYSSKDTIWALHDRCFLLWHGCVRMRNSTVATDTDKAQFAIKAWVEADNLEQALNRHACVVEKSFIYHALDYIFNTRMYISCGFQQSIPLVSANVNGLFHRSKAEEWLTHQAAVVGHFMSGLYAVASNPNDFRIQRPFLAFCFMGQIHRTLSLWECDSTLTVALDVCKALVRGTDYLTKLWPCDDQRSRYELLRNQVTSSCFIAGVEAPPTVDLTLPPSRAREG